MSGFRKLLHELHHRSLWQVLGIYLIAGYAAFEVVQTLVEGLGLPEWFPAFALVLLIIGLPVVLATAFVQEGAPGRGSARSLEELDRIIPDHEQGGPGAPRRLLTWKNAIGGGVAAFALWGVVATAWLLLGDPPGRETAADRASVAVLPFDNMSGDEANDPFTAGIHDDILTQLSKIASLKVISRTSVLEYRGGTKNIRDIARELDVATVLEGGVQRSGERVRINAQLIDATTDEHLWAETFDRELTAASVFAVQSEIAQEIAAALQATLTPEERERIERRPTDDLEAYDFYARGGDYRTRSYGEEDSNLAIRMFEGAVERDPDFALAWAALSEAHSFHYFMAHDRSPERLERAREAARRALELDPELPQAHAALGLYHYRGFQDYERAVPELARAQRSLPGDASLRASLAAALRRSGRMEEALHHFKRTAELNPRSASAWYELGGTYFLMRRYREAILHFDRAIALAPDWSNPYGLKARAVLDVTGDLQAAWEVVDAFPDDDGLTGMRFLLHLYAGDYAALLRINEDAETEVYEFQWHVTPKAMSDGEILTWMGRTREALTLFDSARVIVEERLAGAPADPRLHAALGQIHAWLGHAETAVRHARRAVELHPVSSDAVDGSMFLQASARTLVLAGRLDEALDELEAVYTIPGRPTLADLRFDPIWDPLREHPRFRRLLERVEAVARGS